MSVGVVGAWEGHRGRIDRPRWAGTYVAFKKVQEGDVLVAEAADKRSPDGSFFGREISPTGVYEQSAALGVRKDGGVVCMLR